MDKWLNEYKLRLSIVDNLRDDILKTYLKLAREAIWTQYYERPLPIDEDDEWASDDKTKMATIHLAVTFFENPDINNEAKDVRDDRMIFRILANRVKYI